MLLMTETNLDLFHAQLLAPQDAPAMDQLCAACGTPGGPDTAALLQTNAVLGDYAGTDTLQAAMGMLPMFGQSRLALALRAAGFGADGQGIVLAPPAFTAQYLPVRRFLAMALGLAKQRCASYHIWAALPLTPTPDGEELCAQYLASGLTLRAVVPLDSQQLLAVQRPTPRWAAAARCAAYTCRTPPCRAFWSAAAPWQILAGINRALSSACGEWNKETDACRRFL